MNHVHHRIHLTKSLLPFAILIVILYVSTLTDLQGLDAKLKSGIAFRSSKDIQTGVVKMIQWYAFQSKPRKEELLCEQLRIRQIEIFFPCIHVKPINPRARKIRPYLPGYVFGHVDLQEVGRSVLDWIPGAIGVVSFGGEPASVPDHLISALKQHVETIDNSDELPETFQPGEVVVIQAGPFAGYEAIFNARLSGQQRVEVLLKMLQGFQVRVQLSKEQITSSGSSPSFTSKRS